MSQKPNIPNLHRDKYLELHGVLNFTSSNPESKGSQGMSCSTMISNELAKDRLMHTLTQLIDELFSRVPLDFGPCCGRVLFSCTQSPTKWVTRRSSCWGRMDFAMCNANCREKRGRGGRGFRDLSGVTGCRLVSWRVLHSIQGIFWSKCSRRVCRGQAGHALDKCCTGASDSATPRQIVLASMEMASCAVGLTSSKHSCSSCLTENRA